MSEMGQFRPPPPPLEKPIWVDFDMLYGPARDEVAAVPAGSIRERMHHSLHLTGRVPGTLRGWVRSIDGRWLGLCDFVIPSIDGAQVVRQEGVAVPAAALAPRTLPPMR
ncbi:hypothetical protein [Pseudonocardia sp. HH130629-09]|uniref:hypothetical protein n=1 Tax=Pseudonocardia sp. HH130629-09 TaxID=1641402 RepID=UPI0006CB58F4|nr:hypothetical protein [Pseudonocardia sp. HH130629-09]ALE82475.1 hypothetical protein XF36_04390 [Pseudonocardia sp. HH130629-09]